MAGATTLSGALVGRLVVDAAHRRVGRVVAVIHKAAGIDVLVERRHLCLWRHTCRVSADDIRSLEDGRLVVGGRYAASRMDDLDVEADEARGIAFR